jgi:hypothetical protein
VLATIAAAAGEHARARKRLRRSAKLGAAINDPAIQGYAALGVLQCQPTPQETAAAIIELMTFARACARASRFRDAALFLAGLAHTFGSNPIEALAQAVWLGARSEPPPRACVTLAGRLVAALPDDAPVLLPLAHFFLTRGGMTIPMVADEARTRLVAIAKAAGRDPAEWAQAELLDRADEHRAALPDALAALVPEASWLLERSQIEQLQDG